MNKDLIIALVAKAPFLGRKGPVEEHDWYRATVLAVEMHRANPNSQIAIVSAFEIDGVAEVDIYASTLAEMGVNNPLIIREGLETISQIEAVERVAKERDSRLTFVSTALHRLRVWYYAKSGAIHRSAWGTPHPHEWIKDILAIPFAFLIDLFGLRKKYLEFVERRRKRGVLVFDKNV